MPELARAGGRPRWSALLCATPVSRLLAGGYRYGQPSRQLSFAVFACRGADLRFVSEASAPARLALS